MATCGGRWDKLHNARAILFDLRTTGPDVFGLFKGAGKARSGITGAWPRSSTSVCPAPVLEMHRTVKDVIAEA
jgi:hypothetical protein